MASTRPKVNPGRLISLVDYKWRTDRLPHEDVVVPVEDLPDPDADQGAVSYGGGAGFGQGSSYGSVGQLQQHETLRDIERRWNDLALYRVYRPSHGGGGSSSNSRPAPINSTTRSTSSTGQGGGTGPASAPSGL